MHIPVGEMRGLFRDVVQLVLAEMVAHYHWVGGVGSIAENIDDLLTS